MHKLKQAQYKKQNEEKTGVEIIKTENPFAALGQESSEEEDEDYDDKHLKSEKDRYLYKQMTKQERKEHKKILEEYDAIYNPLKVFPAQTWSDYFANPYLCNKAQRLHKDSVARRELNAELLAIDVKRKELLETESNLSHILNQKIEKLAKIAEPYADEEGNVPQFDLLPATLTENPNALYIDILSQTKELASNQERIADLTRQYDITRELRDLLHQSISISIEEQRLERKHEISMQVNSEALRATLLKRKKNLEEMLLKTETNKILIQDGNVNNMKHTEMNQDKIDTMFKLRFKTMIKQKEIVVENNENTKNKVLS
jgi:hypothetical protein